MSTCYRCGNQTETTPYAMGGVWADSGKQASNPVCAECLEFLNSGDLLVIACNLAEGISEAR